MATTTTRWIYICGIGVVDDVKLGGMDWVGWLGWGMSLKDDGLDW